jgi:hypothetical protein
LPFSQRASLPAMLAVRAGRRSSEPRDDRCRAVQPARLRGRSRRSCKRFLGRPQRCSRSAGWGRSADPVLLRFGWLGSLGRPSAASARLAGVARQAQCCFGSAGWGRSADPVLLPHGWPGSLGRPSAATARLAGSPGATPGFYSRGRMMIVRSACGQGVTPPDASVGACGGRGCARSVRGHCRIQGV